MECCMMCKYIRPMKELVGHEWRYKMICTAWIKMEPDDPKAFAIVIRSPMLDVCEMYSKAEGKSEH